MKGKQFNGWHLQTKKALSVNPFLQRFPHHEPQNFWKLYPTLGSWARYATNADCVFPAEIVSKDCCWRRQSNRQFPGSITENFWRSPTYPVLFEPAESSCPRTASSSRAEARHFLVTSLYGSSVRPNQSVISAANSANVLSARGALIINPSISVQLPCFHSFPVIFP